MLIGFIRYDGKGTVFKFCISLNAPYSIVPGGASYNLLSSLFFTYIGIFFVSPKVFMGLDGSLCSVIVTVSFVIIVLTYFIS